MGTGYSRNDTSNNIADGNIINAADLDGEFDAIQSAFDASTGHTHDGTTAEGAPITVTGPAQEYVSTGTELRPKANNTYDLGSLSNQWKDLYVDGTGYIDSVDIDGGTIDGVTIGGSSAAAGTFTTATATTGNITNVNATTVDTTNIEVTNLKAKDGTAAGSIADSTGVVTLASSVLTTTDINGGTIDGVTIGGSSAGAITGTTITGSSFVTTGDMTFGDNDKAIFGAGSDLQIYHSGSNSFIEDQGTGFLYIKTDRLNLQNAAGTENLIQAISDGAVNLYYDNAAKLATTSTGVDITGTITSDGLTVDVTSITGQTLHNSAGASIYTRYQNNSGNDNYIGYTGNNFDVFPNNVKALTVASGGDISFYEDTGTTAKMVWKSAEERLGIGTSSPEVDLHVSSSSSTKASFERTGATGVYIGLKDSSGSLVYLGGNSGAFEVQTPGSSYSTKLVITSAGNVGIGTSSPSVKLDIDQPQALTSLTSPANAALRLQNTNGAADNYFTALSFTTSTTGVGTDSAIVSHSVTAGNSALAFYTDSSNVLSEAMRIDSLGNVGIGTTSPKSFARLTINGAGTAGNPLGGIVLQQAGTDVFYITNIDASNNTDIDLWNPRNGFVRIGTNNTERMRIDASGNVGIGTSSIGARITLGDASSTDSTNMIRSYRGGGTSTYAEFGEGSGGAKLEHVGGGPVYFKTGGTERMRIDSNGNVGIGTSSITSDFKLDVIGDARFSDAAGDDGVELGWSAGGSAGYVQAYDRGASAFRDLKLNNEVTITSGGNVGIGTSSPVANTPLTLQGPSGYTDTLWLKSAGTNIDSRINIAPTGTGNAQINNTVGTAIEFQTSGAERMRIDASGNVGIGTSSPSYHLTVAGKISYNGAIGEGADNTLSSSSTTLILGESSTWQNLSLRTNGTERMRIDSSGNVGIGTSSPTSDLMLYKSGAADTTLSLANNGNGGGTVKWELKHDTAWDLTLSHNAAIGGQNLIFGTKTSGGESMRIDASGNVGVGLAPLGWSSYNNVGLAGSGAHYGTGAGSTLSGISHGCYYDGTNWKYAYTGAGATRYEAVGLASPYQAWYTANSGTADATITFSEAMRIDSSGNLLVGKTADNLTDAGQVFTTGGSSFTRSGGAVCQFNRNTNDGEIVRLSKDGTTVGSIGSASGQDIYIGSGAVGLRFRDATVDTIRPYNVSTGNDVDGTIDLGLSTARFKDLYLSGGVYLGGTGAANHLDDYETGTWTPVITGATVTGTGTYTSQDGTYVKVGKVVTLNFDYSVTAHTGSGAMRIGGLPFASATTSTRESTGSCMTDNFNFSNSPVSVNTFMGTGVSVLRLYISQDDAGWVQQDIDTAHSLIGSITYITD